MKYSLMAEDHGFKVQNSDGYRSTAPSLSLDALYSFEVLNGVC